MAFREVTIPLAKAAMVAAKKFRPPISLEEGEQRRLLLVDKLNDINGELTIKNNARDENGGFAVEGAEYWDWRRRAVTAKKFVESELRHLNAWLKQQRRARNVGASCDLGFDAHDPTSLLLAAANVFQRLRSDGVEVDPEEVAVFDAVKLYLAHEAPPAASKESDRA